MKKLILIFLFLAMSSTSNAAIIFEDDFESSSTAWPLATPSGQTGYWDSWESNRTCSNFGCSNCAALPAEAGGKLMYKATTGGYDNSKAIRILLDPSCDGQNGYLGSFDWVSPGGYTELYYGYHMKIDSDIGGSGDWCKFPHWIDQGTSSGSVGNSVNNQWWFEAFGMNLGSSDQLKISIQTGSADIQSYWGTGVYGNEIKDGDWHWVEWHVKGNSSSSASDAVIEVWVDGVLQGQKTNFKTYAAGKPYIYDVKWEIGNCSADNNFGTGSWTTGWKSIYIDNVKISNTYIGPPGGSEEDTEDPTIAITSPTSSSTYDNGDTSTINISGTASDNIGVTSVTWVNSRGGSGTASGTSPTWSVSAIQLYDGSNVITVTAVDAALNSSTDTITVTYTPGVTTPLLSESFSDSSFASRGWYDNTSHGTIVSGGQSGNCLQWAWTAGQQKPANGGSMRHSFTPSEEITFTTYVKFQSTWRGSQQTYHPHLFMILSDLDDAWQSPYYAYLNTYVEFLSQVGSPYAIYPQTQIQDNLRVAVCPGSSYPCDLTSTTEYRAVGQCNGTIGDAGTQTTCYYDEPDWIGERIWRNTGYSVTKDSWQKVTAHFKMNTVVGGVGQADGIMKVWIGEDLVINKTNISYRTGQDATKKFAQMVLAPYIGDGSPITQTMWVDELVLMAGEPGGSDTTAPYTYISSSDPSYISSDLLSVTATCTDNVGVTSAKWRMSAAPDVSNGTACTCDDGTCDETSEAVTCSTSGYTRGANTLYVGCGDAVPNWGAGDSIVVNYNLPATVTNLKIVGGD